MTVIKTSTVGHETWKDRLTIRLPGLVNTAAHVTDGHLAELAKAYGAIRATLDRRIPGALSRLIQTAVSLQNC